MDNEREREWHENIYHFSTVKLLLKIFYRWYYNNLVAWWFLLIILSQSCLDVNMIIIQKQKHDNNITYKDKLLSDANSNFDFLWTLWLCCSSSTHAFLNIQYQKTGFDATNSHKDTSMMSLTGWIWKSIKEWIIIEFPTKTYQLDVERFWIPRLLGFK